MSLNEFISKEPRALPIFILADKSGSMSGEKISELNLALREMLNSLRNVDDIRGKFQLSVIGFGGNVDVVQPLADIEGIILQELSADGETPMGEAFSTVTAMIEDKNVVSSRAYTPTIVLISDGQPTDFYSNGRNYLEWEPLQKLHSGNRTAKCQRLAMGIGSDANFEMLKAFVKNPELPIVKARDASGISAFFRWVTMSTINRMNSVNPNETSVMPPVFDVNSVEVII